MDWLNGVGIFASAFGLIISIYTLYKVSYLPTALKQHSRDKYVSDLIDKVTKIPKTKPKIPDSTAREVQACIKTIRLYYVSKVPFTHRKLKAVSATLEAELKAEKQLGVVQHQLYLIRDEMTIR